MTNQPHKIVLNELCKLDDEWRLIALKICKDKQLADDLVNDMYLKMHDLKPKTWNKHYISYAMYHLYIDYIRKNTKTVFLEDIDYKTRVEENYTTEMRKRIDNILNELGLFDREILLHTHEKSLRKTGEELLMSYGKVHYRKLQALEKFLETQGVKLLRDEQR